jgi:predicted metal-dependent phosphoesterase TrpH
MRLDAWGLAALVLGAAVGASAPPQGTPEPPRWFKGNTHTHTTESDGDSTPEEVTRWYAKRDYNFLVLTDHNVHTPIDELAATFNVPGRFLLMRGEEVSSGLSGKSIHVNGLDTRGVVGRQTGTSILDILQKSVDAIRRQSGVPHINHPNFTWALTADQLQQVRDNTLFEIHNGHPMVNNAGGGGVPGLEAAWDAILSNGVLLYGIAVDDAHHFKQPWNRELALPGRAWVTVRAPRLEARAILDAMERGDFYASTGIVLDDVQATRSAMTIVVRKASFAKYRIQFIGRRGALLHEALESPATYTFRGDEGYVRAKVLDSNGLVAWCQPIMVSSQ